MLMFTLMPKFEFMLMPKFEFMLISLRFTLSNLATTNCLVTRRTVRPVLPSRTVQLCMV